MARPFPESGFQVQGACYLAYSAYSRFTLYLWGLI